MKLRLQIRQTPDNCYSWDHTGPAFRIGRDPGCELSIKGEGSQSVSWNHARAEITTAGLSLTDLGSSNGTYINGKRAQGRSLVRKGDLIELGRTGPKLEITELDVAGAAPPPPDATAFEQAPSLPAKTVIPASVQGVLAPGVVKAASSVVDASGGSTRMMLVKLQTSQRRSMMLVIASLAVAAAVIALVLFVILPVVGIVLWKSSAKPTPVPEVVHAGGGPAPRTGEELYQTTLRSAVWVVVPQGGEKDLVSLGSGSLVDRERKLVVTNHHVVGEKDRALVFFAARDESGRLLNDKKYYIQNMARLGIVGRVLVRDVMHDLALIELERVPDGVPPIKLAEEPARPGQKVHTVGNPGNEADHMWQYTEGAVRQVGPQNWRYIDGIERQATVVETANPINPGDSGGAVVNEHGEMVAVVAGGKAGNLQNFCIDVSEVKAVLQRR